MIKIAITGSSGFVGQHLIKRLQKEGNVDLQLFDHKKNDFFRKETLFSLVKDCDYCYHLAGVSDSKTNGLFKINVLATLNLLSVIARTNPKCKLIFPSSFSVYKSLEEPRKIRESSILFPRNRYGLSKMLAEKVIIYFSKKRRVNSVILRISNIYGPGMQPDKHSVIATFLNNLKKGKVLTVKGSGKQTRDFIFIDDVVEAMLSARQVSNSCEIINICSGKSISINRLISLLEKVTNKKANVVYVNKDLKPNYWLGDNSYAARVLNWRPSTNFLRGLFLTFNN